MKTKFSGIYMKKAGAGFCGEPDIVRTPSLSEVLKQICHRLLVIAFDDPNRITDYGKKLCRELIDQPLDQAVERLVDELYFEPCSVCGGEDCREWHEVYGMTNGRTYCHVSECELEPYEMEKDDEIDAGEDLPFREWLDKHLGELLSDEAVLNACIEEALPGSVEESYQKKGYADALQDILSIVKAQEGKFEAKKEGDALEDV